VSLNVKRKNPLKSVAVLLLPFALLFGVIGWIRNALYDYNIIRSARFSLPTIGVGNLVVGGTGKTPHIEYLIRLLEPYINVATLSRGYGRKTIGFLPVTTQSTSEQVGDEPLLLKYKFPPLPVFVGENRALAIPALLQNNPQVQVVLMDDIFQHRSVSPYLNILLTEYDLPYFNDFLLPVGAMRESREGAERGDCIIVTKCPSTLTAEEEAYYREKLSPLPHQEVFFSTFAYGTPYRLFNTQERLELTPDMEIILFSGIAGTDYLLTYLKSKVSKIHSLEYGDHHYFTNQEIGSLKVSLDQLKVDKKIILTTEKDAVRLALHRPFILEQNLPIYNLPAEVRFIGSNSDQFDHYIKNKMLSYKS